MQESMFDKLKLLPIFNGISDADFVSILQKLVFEFHNLNTGSVAIKEGGHCDTFNFLLSGRMVSRKESRHIPFVFEETLEAPYMIEPYSLFGKVTRYSRTYRAETPVSLVTLDKNYIYTELAKYNICRMNILNILCGRIQNYESHLWGKSPQTVQEKFACFLAGLSETTSGEKRICAKLSDLATILDMARINLSKELNRLASEGKIELSRMSITIHSLADLI